jgi:hypothetical protein
MWGSGLNCTQCGVLDLINGTQCGVLDLINGTQCGALDFSDGTQCGALDLILFKYEDHWRAAVYTVMNLGVPKTE